MTDEKAKDEAKAAFDAGLKDAETRGMRRRATRAKLANPMLTEAERRLIDCAAKGETWTPALHDDAEPDMDPAHADNWDQSRTLRATVIACLATGNIWPGEAKPWRVSPKGLMIEGARVCGSLDLEGAVLLRTLWLQKCAFDNEAILQDAKTLTISFLGSRLPRGINANRSRIQGSLHLSNGFATKGAVNLKGAKIEGQLACGGGLFENPSGTALNGDALTVGADIFLSDGFAAKGEVNLIGAKIEGQLACSGGTFEKADGDALVLNQAEIKGALFLGSWDQTAAKKQPTAKIPCTIKGGLNLSQASCRTFTDDQASWPQRGMLSLDGFTYQRFHRSETDAEVRSKWLKLQSDVHLKDDFRPQPWTQAVKVLREMGYDRDARDLAVEREIARMNRAAIGKLEWWWLWLLRYTIGFGYKPHYALGWSLGFFLFGWVIFASAANLGFMGPRDGSVEAWLAEKPDSRLPLHYPRFNAPIYALDAYIPVIELGQDAAWAPASVQSGQSRETSDGFPAAAARLALGHDWSISGKTATPTVAPQNLWNAPFLFGEWLFRNGFHRFVYWLEGLLGWIFVSLYIAGMSGILKRE